MHRCEKLDAISTSHHPKELRLGWQVSDALPDEQALGAAVEILDTSSSGGRLEVTQQAPDKGGFARSIGSEEPEDGVLMNRKVAFVECPKRPILLGEFIYRKDCRLKVRLCHQESPFSIGVVGIWAMILQGPSQKTLSSARELKDVDSTQ